MIRIVILSCFVVLSFSRSALAMTFRAGPSDYKTYLSRLSPGDSLILDAGTYTQQLRLVDIRGEEEAPIVITGPVGGGEATFTGNACCNTVSLTRCAYLTISYLTIDGKNIPYVDAVKAEGNSGNWTHHITLHHLQILRHGPEQQTVGISTKCPSWDWHIHHNTIIEAGTGMYLGNSNGEEAFVNGVIEYNLIANTTGYNLQIKRQNDDTRQTPGMPQAGKTIIRYNTFVKEKDIPGNSPRPNLLVGGFPPSTAGEDDRYEIYGNLFWQNQTEKLFQGTGNIAFHHNVLVNQFPNGGGINIQKHHGRTPREVYIFQNTLWTKGRSINFEAPDLNYTQIASGNAVFSDKGPRNVPVEDANFTTSYAEASRYLLSPSNVIDQCVLTPKEDTLYGPEIDPLAFSLFDCYSYDFSGNRESWRRRGAYSRCCSPLWSLAIAIRPNVVKEGTTGTRTPHGEEQLSWRIAPSRLHAGQTLQVVSSVPIVRYEVWTISGIRVRLGEPVSEELRGCVIHTGEWSPGIYVWVGWTEQGQRLGGRIVLVR